MELGLTFPLQRFLRQKPPPYGAEPNRRVCWDLHVITLRGRKSLLAVQCHSRYTFVLYDLSGPEWEALPRTFLSGLGQSLLAAGLDEGSAGLGRGAAPQITRTHGRREVAFLNQAWEDVLALDHCVDERSQNQPLLDRAVNAKPSRCAGFQGLGTAAERILCFGSEAEHTL